MLVIHAVNIHNGGGSVLLKALVSSCHPEAPTLLLVDERLKVDDFSSANIVIKYIKPTIFSRFFAECLLYKKTMSNDVVICFGNLPPLFKLKAVTYVFVQNRLLLENANLSYFPIFVRLRLLFEKFWLHIRRGNAHKFIVQSDSMKKLLSAQLGSDRDVKVIPFTALKNPKQAKNAKNKYDFIYVASFDAHKNHKALTDAWAVLSTQGLYPSLVLTLDDKSYQILTNYIKNTYQDLRLNIFNLGILSNEELLVGYQCSRALIYPSLTESFGLPLIEASHYGLEILASELDFVRDLVDPVQTFDPKSPMSIARAVRRFLGKKESRKDILSAEQFLNSLLNYIDEDANKNGIS